MNDQQKPAALLVATVGSVTRETRLCLEHNLDGYPYSEASFSNVEITKVEAVGFLQSSRYRREGASAPGARSEPLT